MPAIVARKHGYLAAGATAGAADPPVANGENPPATTSRLDGVSTSFAHRDSATRDLTPGPTSLGPTARGKSGKPKWSRFVICGDSRSPGRAGQPSGAFQGGRTLARGRPARPGPEQASSIPAGVSPLGAMSVPNSTELHHTQANIHQAATQTVRGLSSPECGGVRSRNHLLISRLKVRFLHGSPFGAGGLGPLAPLYFPACRDHTCPT
jgi:hypothetical protein